MERGVVAQGDLGPEGHSRLEHECLARQGTLNGEPRTIDWEQPFLRYGVVVCLRHEVVDGLLGDRGETDLPFDECARGLPATETGHISACGDTLPRLLNGRVKCFRGQLDREFGDAGFGTLGSDFHDDSCFHSQAETRR